MSDDLAALRETVERVVVETLQSIHFDGNGCGTHGPNACSVCYGPSPLTPDEIAEHVAAALAPHVTAQVEQRDAAEQDLAAAWKARQQSSTPPFRHQGTEDVEQRPVFGQARWELDQARVEAADLRAALAACQSRQMEVLHERDVARVEVSRLLADVDDSAQVAAQMYRRLHEDAVQQLDAALARVDTARRDAEVSALNDAVALLRRLNNDPDAPDSDGIEYAAETIEGLARVRARAAVESTDQPESDDMCPNCVTPWKCNGPHRAAVESPDQPEEKP